MSAFKNARLELLMRVMRECGDVGAFHIGPARIVLLNAPAPIQELLVERELDFGPSRVHNAFLPMFGPHSLIMLEGDNHRWHRKMNAPSFQHRRLLEFALPMVQHTREQADTWRDGQEVDLNHVMVVLTMRNVSKALLGVELSGETEELAVAFNIANDYISHMVTSLFPLPLSWPTPRNRSARWALDTIRGTIRRIIQERRREGSDKSDFISLLLQARDENGSPLTDEQVLDHTVTTFGAGHATVGSMMSWVFYLLMKHPDVYQRVQAEADSVLQGRLPTAQDLPRLGYGLQVLKETLRLYPTSFLIARAARGDTQLDGWAIRKGDMVLLSPYTLHRHSAYYPEPERFSPERFSPENEKKLPRHTYLPFGTGLHTCIGSHFALMEAHLILTVLSQRLSFELVPGQNIVCVPRGVLEPSTLQVRVRLRAPLPAGQ